ncbi:MAG: DUF5995 family protein, partial [Candidatus Binatia bacterium]
VVFAKLYFAAMVDWQRNRNRTARSWLPLFQSRKKPGIMRVQFAIAGMNAHINHDLPIALVETAKESALPPRCGTAEHRDFKRVNSILETVEEKVKPYIATGIAGVVDQQLGQIDDMLAMWNIGKARDTAWSNSEILWQLRLLPIASVSDDFLLNLDRLVGLASRGLLVPAGLT